MLAHPHLDDAGVGGRGRSPLSRRARAREGAGNQRPWPADKVERWAIDRLIPYAKNARTHTDAQVAAIASSIKEWGWTTPALVGEDGPPSRGARPRARGIAAEGRHLLATRASVVDPDKLWKDAHFQWNRERSATSAKVYILGHQPIWHEIGL